jgi:hypothetical protein
VRFGEAVAIQDQADHDLFAVRAVIPRIAALGLRIALALPFEVRRGQVVEVDRVVQVEQRALAGGQGLFDRGTLGMQPVEIAIQRLITERGEVHAQDVRQRRAPDPVGHGMLRGRPHQPVQRHHFSQQLRARAQAGVSEDRIQLQQVPHLMAHVHGPGFAFVFDPHALGVDREAARLRPRPTARRPHTRGERLDRRIRHQRRLARERGMQSLRGAQPGVLRPRGQRPERAQHPLAGALRRRHGFDEQIVVVGLAADASGRAPQIHASDTVSLSCSNRQAKSDLVLVTILSYPAHRPRKHADLRDARGGIAPFWRPGPWRLG